MAYTKQQWANDTVTAPYGPINATRLQHIEDGLDAVANGGSITYLPASNGVDDTAAIQAVLDAIPAAGGVALGARGAAYVISSSLKIYSNQELDLSGCTITLKAGSNCNMLHNAAWVAGSGRDSNIKVVGGSWDRGANGGVGQQNHTILMQRVDGLYVGYQKHTSTGGKYTICPYACTDFVVEEISGTVFSSFVQCDGACANGRISGIYGTSGDDSVALTNNDYAAYVNGDIGDMTDIVIERVYSISTVGHQLRLLSGNNGGVSLNLKRIRVRDIVGSASQAAVVLGGDTAQANTQGGNYDTITIDGALNTSAVGITSVQINDFGTNGTTGGTARGLVLSRISACQNAGSHGQGLYVTAGNNSNTTITDLTVRDSEITSSNAIQPISIEGHAVVQKLTLDNCYVSTTGAMYAVKMTDSGTTISTFRVDGCRIGTCAGLLTTNTTSGMALGDVFVRDLVCDAVTWAVGDFGQAVSFNLYASGVKGTLSQGLANIRAGVTMNIIQGVGLSGSRTHRVANAGTVTGLLYSVGTGVPTIAGNVGDIYDRSDGGTGTYRYRCTVAGVDGAATWVGIL